MHKPIVISLILGILTFSGCDFFDGFNGNDPPVIKEFVANKMQVALGDSVVLNVVAEDPDGDELTYEYEVSVGSILGSGSIVTWMIEEETKGIELAEGEAEHFANVTVSDGDKSVQESVTVAVVKEFGAQPCNFVLTLETWEILENSGLVWGKIIVAKDGRDIGLATVEMENKSTGETGSTQTNNVKSNSTPIGWAFIDDQPGGLPDIRGGDIVKVTVTYAGESCVKCYIASSDGTPGSGNWEETDCFD